MTHQPYSPIVSRTADEWRKILTPKEFHVLREGGTERPWTGEYNATTASGTYACRACGEELFNSDTKFDAQCGWPSFFEPIENGKLRYLEDRSLPGPPRVEVRCATCDSHLGHVFSGEGYDTPTNDRYCINSVCLVFGEEE